MPSVDSPWPLLAVLAPLLAGAALWPLSTRVTRSAVIALGGAALATSVLALLATLALLLDAGGWANTAGFDGARAPFTWGTASVGPLAFVVDVGNVMTALAVAVAGLVVHVLSVTARGGGPRRNTE